MLALWKAQMSTIPMRLRNSCKNSCENHQLLLIAASEIAKDLHKLCLNVIFWGGPRRRWAISMKDKFWA